MGADIHPLQASVMAWGENGVEGRAIFNAPAQAQEALSKIDGTEFDSGRTLKATMAPEELNIGPETGGGSSGSGSGTTKRTKSGDHVPPSPTGIIPPPPPFAPPPPPGGLMTFPTGAYHPYGAPTPGIMTPPRYAPVKNEKDNLPCNTLFLGNLGEGVLEDELRAVFG